MENENEEDQPGGKGNYKTYYKLKINIIISKN